VDDWITEMYGTKVEHYPMPRPGNAPYYRASLTGIGVLHTTENDSVNGVLPYLKSIYSAPLFVTGEDRIVQCRPIWAQGAALRTNSPSYPNMYARVQIEQVAHSQAKLWQPPDSTFNMTVKVVAWCAVNLGIPLMRPTPLWKDDGSDMPQPWAANNKRRQLGIWPNRKGWWHHMEVPFQQDTWHWDCGAYNTTELFKRAAVLLGGDEDLNTDEHAALIDIQRKVDVMYAWHTGYRSYALNKLGLNPVGHPYAEPTDPNGKGGWEEAKLDFGA
jgi:hypothetical protein